MTDNSSETPPIDGQSDQSENNQSDNKNVANLSEDQSNNSNQVFPNQPIVRELYISLENVLKGCTKKRTIARKILDSNNQLVLEEKTLAIKVLPGAKIDSQITFPHEGNQSILNRDPGDVVFTIKNKPHKLFKRVNHVDIEYTVYISLDATESTLDFEIPTLEPNEPIVFSIDADDFSENLVEKVRERGLPYFENRNSCGVRGDFIIRFKIKDAKNTDVDIENVSIDLPKNEHKIENQQVLELTLEEILRGCIKSKVIPRKIINSDGSEKVEDKTFSIKIKPGIYNKTPITFYQEGDQLPDGNFADVVFIVNEIPHQFFIRKDTDLFHAAKISQSQLDQSMQITIPLLENCIIKEKLSSTLQESMEKQFYSRGLPLIGDTRMRGSLFVQFEKVNDEEAEEYAKQVENYALIGEQLKKKRQRKNELKIKNVKEIVHKLPANKYNILLTLQDIYRGCTKIEKITRKILNRKGVTISKEDESIEIIVKPGSIDGTTFKFENKGDQRDGWMAADVIFTVIEEIDSVYKREGYNLVYRATITEHESLNGYMLKFPSFGENNHLINWKIKAPITNETIETIENYGLQYLNNLGEKKCGHLEVRFNVKCGPKISTSFESKTKPKSLHKDKDILYDIHLTLENILTGYNKQIKVNRRVIGPNFEKKYVAKMVTVQIPPGCKENDKCRMAELGDENPGHIPADVVFVAREKPHHYFKRKNADIEYTALITKFEAKNGVDLEIPTLVQNKFLKLKEATIMSTNHFKIYPGEGLPGKNNDLKKRGNLIVRFDILDNDKKDSNIEYELEITLEQILQGYVKEMKMNRTVVYGKNAKIEEEKFITIVIEKGEEFGKKYVVSRFGNIRPGRIAGDVIVKTVEKPHANFKRTGVDLEYILPNDWQEQLLENFNEICITTLENECMFVKYDEKISDQKRIIGKGLPCPDDPTKRGDILIYFQGIQNEKTAIENKLPKDGPICMEIDATLEQIFEGFQKNFQFKHETIAEDGTANIEDKILLLDFKPGSENGHRITFEGAYHKKHNTLPADMIFVLKELPHEFFRRNGADIEITIKISPEEAQNGFRRNIPTFKNEYLLDMKSIDKTAEILKEYGLPYFENSDSGVAKKYGNLVVNFEIVEHCNKESNNTEDKPIGKMNNINEKQKEIFLDLTLREILKGTTKKLKIEQKVIKPDGGECVVIKKHIIALKPGTETNTKIFLKGYGDYVSSGKPGDLVCVIRDKPHKEYERRREDIIMKKTIKSSQLTGYTLKFVSLLKKKRQKIKNAKIDSENKCVVQNEGLPYPNDPTKRGNLVVMFNIVD